MAASAGPEPDQSMVKAASMTALDDVSHAFFTRVGGVSDGIYASLNGGPGSDDTPARVTENRARMAAAVGVATDWLVTAYQIHSPDVVTIDRPWAPSERPRADAIVTRRRGLAIGVTRHPFAIVADREEVLTVVAAARDQDSTRLGVDTILHQFRYRLQRAAL